MRLMVPFFSGCIRGGGSSMRDSLTELQGDREDD